MRGAENSAHLFQVDLRAIEFRAKLYAAAQSLGREQLKLCARAGSCQAGVGNWRANVVYRWEGKLRAAIAVDFVVDRTGEAPAHGESVLGMQEVHCLLRVDCETVVVRNRILIVA